MMKHLSCLSMLVAALVALPSVAAAQLRPGAFSTLVTTDTSATSVCVGANTVAAPSTCTGGLKAGPIVASGDVTLATSLQFTAADASPLTGPSGYLNANQLTLSGGTSGFKFVSQDTLTTLASLTNGGVLTVSGFGVHSITAGGTGPQTVQLRNTTAGTTMTSRLALGNNLSTDTTLIESYSSTYTSSGASQADGSIFAGTGAGGVSIATLVSAPVRTYTNGTLRWSVDTSGHFVPGADDTYNLGSTTASVNRAFFADGLVGTPAITFADDSDTGWFRQTGAIYMTIDGTLRFSAAIPSGTFGNAFTVAGGAFGTGNQGGGFVIIGRNSSGSGAAGTIGLERSGGGFDYVWSDNTGVLRIGAAAFPHEDGTPADTSGTVVGAQTSTRASKIIFGAFTDNESALKTVLSTPLYNFRYRNGQYNNTEYVGITTDDSPIFSQDLGRSFNPITSFGYTVAAIKELQRQIDELKRGKQ